MNKKIISYQEPPQVKHLKKMLDSLVVKHMVEPLEVKRQFFALFCEGEPPYGDPDYHMAKETRELQRDVYTALQEKILSMADQPVDETKFSAEIETYLLEKKPLLLQAYRQNLDLLKSISEKPSVSLYRKELDPILTQSDQEGCCLIKTLEWLCGKNPRETADRKDLFLNATRRFFYIMQSHFYDTIYKPPSKQPNELTPLEALPKPLELCLDTKQERSDAKTFYMRYFNNRLFPDSLLKRHFKISISAPSSEFELKNHSLLSGLQQILPIVIADPAIDRLYLALKSSSSNAHIMGLKIMRDKNLFELQLFDSSFGILTLHCDADGQLHENALELFQKWENFRSQYERDYSTSLTYFTVCRDTH